MEQRKKRRSATRNVPTLKTRIEAIDYVKHCCFKKIAVSDADIYKRYGVSEMIRKLYDAGFIDLTKTIGLYFWKPTELTSEDIAKKLWRLHGKVNGDHLPPAQSSETIKPENDESKTLELYRRAELLIERYGVHNRATFIYDYSIGKLTFKTN